ncbi:hypothetical protein SYNPS1DRAFT_26734 [Syncephalis pseudoplumigaleata]|uniref:Uncharacterized protein n=1 Tax=Syncephalis pseudoplumigaleata TaxID=1712513 RepID=A0A4P9Z6W7_9FUNG|nr:hypothetical protein SYNPS1DRAFT_26734 [Syncephalis pseudoplumigaleata]|eukprot:RKP27621.1 hypothetical protein SYNPS1DRAFT_26734 [Syncephalis pseudoplumigaleata]
MLLATKTTLAAVAAMLALVAMTPDTAEAIRWPFKTTKKQPQEVNLSPIPGLQLNPADRTMGTLTRARAIIPVDIKCFSEPFRLLENMGEETVAELYQASACTKYMPTEPADQQVKDSLFCPLAHYMDKNEGTCYVVEAIKREQEIYSKPLMHSPNKVVCSRLDDIIEELKAVHNLAKKLGCYPSWQENDVLLNAKGQLRIDTSRNLLCRRAINLYKLSPTATPFVKAVEKLTYAQHAFVFKLYDKCFPKEHKLIEQIMLMDELPALPKSKRRSTPARGI